MSDDAYSLKSLCPPTDDSSKQTSGVVKHLLTALFVSVDGLSHIAWQHRILTAQELLVLSV